MKLLLVIFLVTAAWLLGLHCAQIEGFPDVLGWGQQKIQQARQGGGDKVVTDAFAGIQKGVLALASPTDAAKPEPPADQPTDKPSEQLSAKAEDPPSGKPLPVPECW